MHVKADTNSEHKMQREIPARVHVLQPRAHMQESCVQLAAAAYSLPSDMLQLLLLNISSIAATGAAGVCRCFEL